MRRGRIAKHVMRSIDNLHNASESLRIPPSSLFLLSYTALSASKSPPYWEGQMSQDYRSANEASHRRIGRVRSRSDSTLTRRSNRNDAAILDTLLYSQPSALSHKLLSSVPHLSIPRRKEFGITLTTLLSMRGSRKEVQTDSDSRSSIALAIPAQSPSSNDDHLVSLQPAFDSNETESRASSILELEISNYDPPPKPELILYSRRPYTRRNRYIISLTIFSTILICMTTYYVYNSSIASNPFLPLLWGPSDLTIFTINVLTQTSVLLPLALTNAVSDNLRWSKACS